MQLASWRFWLGMTPWSVRERRAAKSAISLFFGALIGANLGSFEALSVIDYTMLIVIVSGVVLYMHLAPIAKRRWTTIANLAFMLGLLWFLLLTPFGLALFDAGTKPKPHLFVTLCAWIATAMYIELRPVHQDGGV